MVKKCNIAICMSQIVIDTSESEQNMYKRDITHTKYTYTQQILAYVIQYVVSMAL